jgi:hypothetical protein
MKTIEISCETKNLFSKLKEKYDEGGVFVSKDSPKVQDDAELNSLLSSIFKSFAEDIKKYYNVSDQGW